VLRLASTASRTRTESTASRIGTASTASTASTPSIGKPPVSENKFGEQTHRPEEVSHRVLDHFLVSALAGPLALREGKHIAVLVAHELGLSHTSWACRPRAGSYWILLDLSGALSARRTCVARASVSCSVTATVLISSRFAVWNARQAIYRAKVTTVDRRTRTYLALRGYVEEGLSNVPSEKERAARHRVRLEALRRSNFCHGAPCRLSVVDIRSTFDDRFWSVTRSVMTAICHDLITVMTVMAVTGFIS
jgi:hypothetical protein